MKADFYTEVYNIVREIPEGCVVTYGQLAKLARRPQCSRMVGQPRQISSQLGGTTGIIGERRHYLQEEWLR